MRSYEAPGRRKINLLDISTFIFYGGFYRSGARIELNREPREIGEGPAAVIRDECRRLPLSEFGEIEN